MHGLGYGGMSPSHIEHTVSRQQVQVAIPLSIPQIGPLAAGVLLIEADDRLHAGQAGIEILAVQGILLALSLGDLVSQRECHVALLVSLGNAQDY